MDIALASFTQPGIVNQPNGNLILIPTLTLILNPNPKLNPNLYL